MANTEKQWVIQRYQPGQPLCSEQEYITIFPVGGMRLTKAEMKAKLHEIAQGHPDDSFRGYNLVNEKREQP